MVIDKLKALIFDVDGTLADTERDGHRLAFNQAFTEAGLAWQWTVPLYGELLAVTGGKERIHHFINHYRPATAPNNLETDVAALHARKTEIYTALLVEGRIPLRPGALRILNEARRQGIRLAIATTTTAANVEALLIHAISEDALSWFEVIAAGDVVKQKKPAADIYLYAMQALGVSADNCMAFEDSENGLQSATSAGLKTIITTNDYTKDHRFPGAVAILDGFGEPDKPFASLSNNNLNGAAYLDLALIRKLHSQP